MSKHRKFKSILTDIGKVILNFMGIKIPKNGTKYTYTLFENDITFEQQKQKSCGFRYITGIFYRDNRNIYLPQLKRPKHKGKRQFIKDPLSGSTVMKGLNVSEEN